MKNVYGKVLTVTLFGESHGSSIGAVLDGLAPGIPVKEEHIRDKLAQRRPEGAFSTARKEQDPFVIESGVYRGYTTGTPRASGFPMGIPILQTMPLWMGKPVRGTATTRPSVNTTALRTGGAEDISAAGSRRHWWRRGRLRKMLCRERVCSLEPT